MSIKVIITGVTGMVGEGVLFECIRNKDVSEILIIGRRHYEISDPKVTELLVPDFFQLDSHAAGITGYDACFFCAGISSVGMKEEKYTHITYDTTLSVANSLLKVNRDLSFIYVSGAGTDSSEKGRLMWARVKGRTENALTRLAFKGVYNFRPGVMLPFDGQKNWKSAYKLLARIIRLFSARSVITMHELGLAMIRAAIAGYPQPILEVSDIKKLAR